MKRFTQLSIIVLMLLSSVVLRAQTTSEIPKDTIKIKLRANAAFGKEPLYVIDGKVMAGGINEIIQMRLNLFRYSKMRRP